MKPLPPDYVRPSLAEYLAASKTHRQAEYLRFVEGHESELRKYYVPAPTPETTPPEAADSETTPPEAADSAPTPETIPPEAADSEPETQTEEDNEHVS